VGARNERAHGSGSDALIARNAPKDAKKALLGNLRRLPAWAIGPAQHIAENQATKAG
jgi:hypothetical protein